MSSLIQTVYDNFYIKIMFCGSSDLLERHLHTDMNMLIKNVKIRGDVYLSILQYNKALIAQHK